MLKIPSTQIQLNTIVDSKVKKHLKLSDYNSKNDFIVEVIIPEWLASNKDKIEG